MIKGWCYVYITWETINNLQTNFTLDICSRDNNIKTANTNSLVFTYVYTAVV